MKRLIYLAESILLSESDARWARSVPVAISVVILDYLLIALLDWRTGHSPSFDLPWTFVAAGALLVVVCLFLVGFLKLKETLLWVILVTGAHFLGKLVWLLYLHPHPDHALAEVGESFFWIPVLGVLSIVAPVARLTQGVVVSFFSLFFTLSIVYGLSNLSVDRNVALSFALLQLTLATLTILVFMVKFMGYKEKFIRVQEQTVVLEQLAYTDSLTGLPNRLALETDLAALITEQGKDARLAVAFLDLDEFKLLNDAQGHAVGDALLREVAVRLRGISCQGRYLYRFSGDEFALLFPALPASFDVETLGRRILESLSAPFELPEGGVQLSASVGLTCFPEDGCAAPDLLRHADAAMHSVKRQGKNRYATYQAARDETFENRALLIGELRTALRRGELSLYYQPILDTRRGQVVKLEALLRWFSSTRGYVPPAIFIPLAETHGLIEGLGHYVLEEACRQLVTWTHEERGELCVSVNVSACQLQQPDFAASVGQVLARTGAQPEQLELELTESALIHAFDTVRANLTVLRALGVSVALDDFGTGYSSLSYLETLRVDTIKIDRSFAAKLTGSGSEARYPSALVGAVLEVARVLGAQVVAEGIETEAQLVTFQKLGCHLFQGYYFAAPMTSEGASRFLEGGSRPGAAALKLYTSEFGV